MSEFETFADWIGYWATIDLINTIAEAIVDHNRRINHYEVNHVHRSS